MITTNDRMYLPRSALLGSLASETVKLATLVSVRVLSLGAFAMIVLSGLLFSYGLVSRITDPRFVGQPITAVPIQFVDSVLWAQVLIVVIAVLAATNEYGAGQIQVTLLATPSRVPVLFGKVLATSGLGFVIGVAGSLVSMTLPLVILPREIGYVLDAPTLAGLTLGSGLYLAAIAALAAAAGMLVRNVVGGLVVMIPLVTILPSVLSSLPVQAVKDAVGYFPGIAGRMLISDLATTAPLEPWQGYLVLLAWVSVMIACAGLTLRLRDA
jgi:ABC-2 type transport system permease protein